MGSSFDILAAEYRPMVLSYLRAVLGDEHVAEDLTQETLIAAHERIESFDPKRNFGAWLRGIARNKVLHDRRTASRRPLVVDSCVVEGMEQVYTLFDDAAGPWESRISRVRYCVDGLGESLRTVVLAVYVHGQTLRQAASGLGLSFQAVAKRLSRARVAIRACVERTIPNQSEKEQRHVRTR